MPVRVHVDQLVKLEFSLQLEISRIGIELFCLPLRITFKRPAQWSCSGCPSALLSWGSVGHP